MEKNYLALELPIIAMLVAALGGSVPVQGAGDLDLSKALSTPLPAVFVIYRGDSIPAAAGSAAQLVTQYWSAIIIAAYATKKADDARMKAGVIISKVIDALQGKTPESDTLQVSTPLRRNGGAAPHYLEGRACFEIQFGVGILT